MGDQRAHTIIYLREGLRRLRHPPPEPSPRALPIDKRRRVDVERARHLYRIWRSWQIVAELMPGKFQPDSIRLAVWRARSRT